MRDIDIKHGLGIILVAVLTASVAFAARPLNEYQFWLKVNGSPSSTSEVATSTTAATITETAGDVVLLWCDSATYYRVDGTATATTSILLAAYERALITLPDSDGTISVLALSGTGKCYSSVMQ
jgi:hypothetical protein